jgi:hypothetical protein
LIGSWWVTQTPPRHPLQRVDLPRLLQVQLSTCVFDFVRLATRCCRRFSLSTSVSSILCVLDSGSGSAPARDVQTLARHVITTLWLNPSVEERAREDRVEAMFAHMCRQRHKNGGVTLDLFRNAQGQLRDAGHTYVAFLRSLGKRWQPEPFFLSLADTLMLVEHATTLLAAEPAVLDIHGPCKMFGDIHGQLDELRRLFVSFGGPDNVTVGGDIHRTNYVFIGDFVDRGAHSLEVLVLLLALKIEYPDRVFLLRGNHEDVLMSVLDTGTFGLDCLMHFADPASPHDREPGAAALEAFGRCFNMLPVAALVNQRVLCVHGGVGRATTLDDMRAIPKGISQYQNVLLAGMMWADPCERPGYVIVLFSIPPRVS